MKPRFLIVTKMKNEGPYILEWVAHHLSIGFDHIIAVTNDCTDGTDEMLERLQQLGGVTHLINPAVLDRGQKQWLRRAQRYAQYYPVYKAAEWILDTDVDEFVCLNDGIGTMGDLVDRVQPAQAISLTSMPFSSGGALSFQDRPVRSQFVELTHDLTADPSPLTAVKTLYRNDLAVTSRTNHRPYIPDFSAGGHVWRDGSGRELDAAFTDTKVKTIAASGTTDLAQLNHYAIRSIEAFLQKAARGDAVATDRLTGKPERYFKAYDQRGGLDTRHTTMSAAVRDRFDAYLSDPVLGSLHRSAVDWHRDRAQELLRSGEGYVLARRLGLGDPAFRENRHAPPAQDDAPIDRLHARACPSPIAKKTDLPAIATFWTGGPLSFLEHLMIRSFTEHGHSVHFYTLDDVPEIPDGVAVHRAQSILKPGFAIGADQPRNTAVYRDLLRLYLVRDTGSIWADIGTCCVHPFALPSAHVFGRQSHKDGLRVSGGVLGLPSDSPALARMIAFVETENAIPPFFRGKRQKQLAQRIQGGERIGIETHGSDVTGSRMLDHFLGETGETRFAMPEDVFCSITHDHADPIFEPQTLSASLSPRAKRTLINDFNGVPSAGSFLDVLCQRHGIDPREYPVRP